MKDNVLRFPQEKLTEVAPGPNPTFGCCFCAGDVHGWEEEGDDGVQLVVVGPPGEQYYFAHEKCLVERMDKTFGTLLWDDV